MLSELIIYGKRSGPGWIQAAVTLGGGSLVSSLYLGVIGGYEYLWLQPLAMLCGVTMLTAISYVTLSKPDYEDRPFRLIQRSVSPTLAWGWLLSTVVANVVFCSSQFALATDTIQTNLNLNINSFLITILIFIVVFGLTLLSQNYQKWSHLIDRILKALVAIIVSSFIVVTVLSVSKSEVSLQTILMGLLPDFTMLFRPVDTFIPFLENCGPDQAYWSDYVVSNQRNILIGAFGTAVGINMTFLLPYTLLAKGWNRKERELACFDLVFGLFIPFVLATTCLIIVAATQYHAQPDRSVNESAYVNILDQKLSYDHEEFKNRSIQSVDELRENAKLHDKQMSILLAKRNTHDLASTLQPLLGGWAILIFGLGVLAMAISTILVHMMMNGYAISEAMGNPKSKRLYIYGAVIPALLGMFSPFLWRGSIKTALVIPASVIATIFLPIAYIAFMILINNKKIMADDLPKNRVLINMLMLLAGGVALLASFWAIYGKMMSQLYYEKLIAVLGLILYIAVIGMGIKNMVSSEKS